MADEYLHPPSMRHRATSEAANGGYGEIIEVQGGHIVRSTGKKDRHSKVCTAKGTRDRRVRLSAHTAIQFYDVQDRLGFDRPSKAVDWLIKKAKTSIDELDELPPWNPVDAIRNAAVNAKPRKSLKNRVLLSPPPPPPQQQNLQFVKFDGGGEQMSNNDNESSFLPPSIESDSISDTIKSFFPVVGSSMEAPPPDLLSRTNSQNQDLRLSLHHHHHASASASLLYGQTNPLGFDTSPANWEHQSSEFGRIQRLVAFNNGGVHETGNGGGFIFSPPPPTSFQPLLGQSQLYSQRSTLQSSYTPMIRAWFDPHHHQSISTNELNHHHIPPPGEFSSGFRVPARFQGQEEEQHDKPYSASSISRH